MPAVPSRPRLFRAANRGAPVLAAGIGLNLLLSLLPAPVASAAPEGQPTGTGAQAASSASVVNDRYRRSVVRDDGTTEVEAFPAPVFYERPGAGFVPIDLTLEQAAADAPVRPVAGPAWLPDLAPELAPGAPSVVVGSAAGDITVRHPEVQGRRQGTVESGKVPRKPRKNDRPGEPTEKVSPMDPEASVEPGRAPRPAVRIGGALAGGRDLVTEPTVDGLKQSVVLHERAARAAYETEFDLPEGVTARDGGPGVEFVAKDGKVVGTFGGGVAFDSAVPVPAEVPVTTRLVRQSDGRAVVTSAADPAWARSPQRVMPVTVDPTYTDGSFQGSGPDCGGPADTYSTCDTYVNSDNFAGAYSQQTEIRTGSPGGFQQGSTTIKNDTVSYIKFATDSIGTSCFQYVVTSASLSMYAFFSSAGTENFYAQRAFSSPTCSTTWSSRPSGTTTGQAAFGPATGIRTHSFTVTSIVDSWFRGATTNHGFRVLAGSGTPTTTNGFRKYYSGNTGYSTSPRLTYRFTRTAPQCGVQNQTATGGIESAGLAWNELGGDGGSPVTSYRVTTLRNGVQVKTQTTPKQGFSTSITVGGLAPGAGYSFDIRPINEIGEGKSHLTNTVTVQPRPDTSAPSVPDVRSSSHPNSGVWYPNRDIAATWPSTDDSGQPVSYAVVLDQSGSTDPSGAPLTSSSGGSFTAKPSGRYWLHVRARDAAGNWSATAHFGIQVDVDGPNRASAPALGEPRFVNQGSDRPPLLSSFDRTIDMTWRGDGADAHSGFAGWSYAFVRDASFTPDTATDGDAADSAVTSGRLEDGAWYFHVVAVDRVGNRSAVHTVGPFLIGEATLADALLGTVRAGSDELGLEQFAPYDSHPLGNGTAYVHLRTGNAVVQQDLFTVPGQGLNTVARLTHNGQARGRDSGVGRGWNLSVTDLEGGVEGPLEDLTDASVTDVDINRDITLAAITTAGQIRQDLTDGAAGVTGRLLEFVDGDGTTHRFVRQGSAGGPGVRWLSPPGVDLKVREYLDAAGQAERYELVRPDGVTYTASRPSLARLSAASLPVWRITSVKDRSGNVLTYDHANFGPDGISRPRLTKIFHSRFPDLPIAEFTYKPFVVGAATTDNAGVLDYVTTLPGQPGARTIDVDISDGDLLTGAGHELRAVTDAASSTVADGQRTTRYAYNADRTLVSVTDPRGAATAFGYAAGRPVGATDGGPTVPMLTTVTDRKAAVTTYGYAPLGTAGETRTTVTRPGGTSAEGTDTTVHDISARTVVANGGDDRMTGGNVIRVQDAGTTGPDGAAVPVATTHRWYANKLIQTTDGTGAVTDFRYNDLGLVTEIRQPAPNRTGAAALDGAVTPTGQIINTLTYSRPAGFAYSCADPADDGQAVTTSMRCALIAELDRVVTASNVAGQARVADFRYDRRATTNTGRLEQVIERADTAAAPATRLARRTGQRRSPTTTAAPSRPSTGHAPTSATPPATAIPPTRRTAATTAPDSPWCSPTPPARPRRSRTAPTA